MLMKTLTNKEKRLRNTRILSQIKTEDDIVKAIKKYTPQDASPERRREINNFFVSVYLDNLKKSEEENVEACKEVNNKVLDRAASKVSGYGTGVDAELEAKINKLECFSDQLRYYNIAKETQRWVNYAIWVSVDNKAIGITNIDTETKEFVNGVCKLLHADLQYKNVGVADLELYDPFISGWNNQRFLINYEKIRKIGSLNFQGRINIKNNQVVYDPINNRTINLTSPIKFGFAQPNSGNTLVDPELDPDQTTKNVLESYIGPYVVDRNHWYEKTSVDNTYKVCVKNLSNGITEEYTAVVGYYGKDIVALAVTNILGMRVLLHPAFQEAWSKIFSNYFYQLTDIETNTNMSYMSQFFWLYDLVDLSKIPESEFRNGLDMKLNTIFSSLKNQGINLLGRKFYFENYQNLNKFNLVGDDGSVIYVDINEAAYRLNNTFITVYC